MTLTFYYQILSQPARAVLALLNLGRIKFDPKVINLFNGQTRSPEYLKINPFGGVPFIIHDGLHLAESNAILSHLCESFPNELKQYYGANQAERSTINQYLSWYQGTFRPVLVKPLRTKLIAWKRNQPYSRSQFSQVENKVSETFDFLENRLNAQSPYLVGQNLSIADLLLYHEATNIEYFGLSLNKWTKLERWYNTVQSNQVVGEIHSNFQKEASNMLKIFADLKSVE